MTVPDLVAGSNLGNEFDQGTIEPGVVRLRIGQGLTRAVDGTLSVTLAVATTPVCPVVGWVNVNGDGSIADSCGAGVAVNRTAVGRYTVTPPAGALTVQASVIEGAARDDIVIHPKDFVGATVEITEQDNGGTAGVYRDRAFMLVWLGAQVNVVTGVAAV